MRIYGPNGTTLGSPASNTRRTSSTGFSLPETASTPEEPRSAAAPKAAGNIDALLALQGVEDPTERRKRSVGSSTPCIASRASMLAAAFGGAAERVSSGAVVVSGSANPVELVRRVLLAGDPSVVPFGP